MMVMRIGFDKSPLNIDELCDSEFHDSNVDPRKLRYDQLQYPVIRASAKYPSANVTIASSLQ